MEIVDIYDINKNKTGKTLIRYKEELKPGEYIVGVQAIILNSNNEILISQRSKRAPVLPLKWECNGGAIKSGETSLDGLVREINEELGIKLDKDKAVKIADLFDNSTAEKTPSAFIKDGKTTLVYGTDYVVYPESVGDWVEKLFAN